MALEESLVQEIQERLNFHRAEARKMEMALSIFTEGETPAPATPTPRGRPASGNGRKRTTGRRGRPAGSGGGPTRADQAFSLVQQKPGMTIPEIAQAMGIEANYLYRVMPKLENDGRVRKEGQGYHASVS